MALVEEIRSKDGMENWTIRSSRRIYGVLDDNNRTTEFSARYLTNSSSSGFVSFRFRTTVYARYRQDFIRGSVMLRCVYVDRMQKKKHTLQHCRILPVRNLASYRYFLKYDPFVRFDGADVLCDTRETPTDRNNTYIREEKQARGNREYEEISIYMDFRGQILPYFPKVTRGRCYCKDM